MFKYLLIGYFGIPILLVIAEMFTFPPSVLVLSIDYFEKRIEEITGNTYNYNVIYGYVKSFVFWPFLILDVYKIAMSIIEDKEDGGTIYFERDLGRKRAELALEGQLWLVDLSELKNE